MFLKNPESRPVAGKPFPSSGPNSNAEEKPKNRPSCHPTTRPAGLVSQSPNPPYGNRQKSHHLSPCTPRSMHKNAQRVPFSLGERGPRCRVFRGYRSWTTRQAISPNPCTTLHKPESRSQRHSASTSRHVALQSFGRGVMHRYASVPLDKTAKKDKTDFICFVR
jgi:hypothetical protein